MSIYTLNQFDKTNYSLSRVFDVEYNPIDVTEEQINDIGDIIKQFGKHNIMYGKKHSDETRAKMKGRKVSEETRAKMAARTPWNKGIKGAQKGRKGRKVSEETRAKMSASHKRRQHELTRARIADRRKKRGFVD